jgi:hypothetical protein
MARAQPNPQEEINAVIEEAKKKALIILDRRFTEEISAVKWDWPNEPKIRDIVNTGALRASQTREETDKGVRFSWPVEYAVQVHDGGVLKEGNKPFPGRPWTKQPLDEFAKTLAELIEKGLINQRYK